MPAVAVASASHIYIYKNMRPYFKFTLPTLDISPQEKELWDRANEGNMELSALCDGLQSIRAEVGTTTKSLYYSTLFAQNDVVAHLLLLPLVRWATPD